ncbi:MAG: PEP-CTERM sorting domain-containing protein [Acidobacteriota bacterium]|nr:PEP-CTERM sorting domain-containing protein [Acidobacteriota bacterium]
MGKRIMFKVLALAGLLAFAAAAPALADTITTLSVSNPSDGFGSSYTLTATCDINTSVCSSVQLAINSTGATYGYISDVAFKIGTTDTLTGTLSAPTSGWLTTTSSLSTSGCTGTNSDGQLCSYATGNFAATGGTLTWTWTNVAVSGTISIAHVGYKYDASNTLGSGLIVSDDYPATSAPEPSSVSMMLFGLVGLFGLAFARRHATLS